MNLPFRTGLLLLPALAALALAAPSASTFTLTTQASAWTLGPTQTASTTIEMPELRGSSGSVQLSIEGPSTGTGRNRISATFGALKNGSSPVKVTVGADVPVGTYPITLRATAGALSRTVALQVKVERWLLVDADRSANNSGVTEAHRPNPSAGASKLDALMKDAVKGKIFDTYAVRQGSMTTDLASIGGPSASVLRTYSHVLWYTGTQDYQVPVKEDYDAMRDFLNHDERRLVLLAPALVVNMNGAANVFQTTEPEAKDQPLLATQKRFLKDMLGVAGYHGTYTRDSYNILPVKGSVASALGAFVATGGNNLRAAFQPQDDPAVSSLFTAPVKDQRNSVSTGSIVLMRKALGPKRNSSAMFMGVSPDLLQSSNTPTLLRSLISF